MRKLTLGLAAFAVTLALGAQTPALAQGDPAQYGISVADVLWQPSMNVFRRHEVSSEEMFHFYGNVLGLQQLETFDVGGAGGASQVARFEVGNSQVKFTHQVEGRTYEKGGVTGATGLRLLSFFYEDEDAVIQRFLDDGREAPAFQIRDGRRSAIVTDPDGQPVELVIGGNVGGIEVGLTVSDMAESEAFYTDFVGLEDMGVSDDPIFGGRKHSLRHGTTIVTLRHFGPDLPKDTGSGGIQYVVSDAGRVDQAAKANRIPIDQPLSGLDGFDLITIWLDDPDGITNYFAQTGEARDTARPD